MLLLVCLIDASAVPVTEPASDLAQVNLALTVFDQHSARSADASKNYVIFAYDNEVCVGEKATKCAEFETALNSVKNLALQDDFAKYKEHVSFGKANKDDFPEHKQDFEKAKVPLPAVLFWPAGHSRPSCKYDDDHPSGDRMFSWLLGKLKEEDDDDLLELDEGGSLSSMTIVDPSVLVCQADGGPNVVVDNLECSDLIEKGAEAEQGLMQLEKTQKIWDYKTGDTKFIGPADNSLPHVVDSGAAVEVHSLDNKGFVDLTKQKVWQAIYFHAPWCKYCGCLEPVWNGVAKNLVGTLKQPELVVSSVDGDVNPELRNIFNVTVYPTFVVVNKDGSKVLGRYLGPRKVFELSNWIEDLIVADENPVVKHQFDVSEQGSVPDLNPVYPYSGSKAFGVQALASLESSLGVSGNDFDECVDSDEAKFTSPGVALLVHYASSTDVHALEMDIQTVSTQKIPQKPTVVDFMAPWCPHCQRLNPVWDAVSAEFSTSNEVIIGKVDTEAHPDVKREFGIHRFPTIMYFDAGKAMKFDEGHRYTGQRDSESLKKWIKDVVLHH